MKNILDYIEQMKDMYEGPRITAQEPRNMDQAALVDELEPGALKDEMLGNFDPSQETYEEYLRRINLERPFNMAEGGSPGQLVTPSVDGSRPGYGERTDYSSPTKKQKQIAEKVYGKDFHKLDTIKKYGIVHGHTTGRMNVSGSGGTPTTEQPSLIKKVEKILKQNIEKKGGANVFKITKGVTKDGYKKNGLIDKVIKGTDGKLRL